MAYTLGNTTLPKPSSMARRFVETSETNTIFNGTTRKRSVNIKEQFILKYILLTPEEVGHILYEYELNVPRDFSVDDLDLQIPATAVLVDITERGYNTVDPGFLEDLTLVLTEVQ